MDDAIRKARVLIEALGWIQQFRGRYVVIKLGGSTLDDQHAIRSFLTDVIFMETVGMHPVLIHGGGKSISRAMQTAGIEPKFVHGRRYTDEATLKIASTVLSQEISTSLAEMICEQGGRAKPLHFGSQNCLFGKKLVFQDPVSGESLDLGRVGEVTHIDEDLLRKTCTSEHIPVIPSIAMDEDGQLLNVNADTAAANVARLLKAEKLVFLSDVPGIFRDLNDRESLISHLETKICRDLIADGTIDAGMVPKVDAALDALDAGVRKVHIVDACMPHSLLLEIYSDKGIGTEIVA